MINTFEMLLLGEILLIENASDLMADILNGNLNPYQISAALGVYQLRKPTAEELSGFVHEIKKHQIKTVRPSGLLLDTCGTGGDGLHTFNISTTATFVAAAAGVNLAKHGNRAMSSRSGAFDVLEALNIPIHADGERPRQDIENYGLGFYFAQNFHPVLKTLAPIRKALGFKTLFNLLGPLLNPVEADCQLIGVYDLDAMRVMAKCLALDPRKRALLVHGADGLDELSLSGESHIIEVKEGRLNNYSITPEQFGFESVPAQTFIGGGATENAYRLEKILQNQSSVADRQLIQLNAGAAIYLYGISQTLEDGVLLAGDFLQNGKSFELLSRMREASYETA